MRLTWVNICDRGGSDWLRSDSSKQESIVVILFDGKYVLPRTAVCFVGFLSFLTSVLEVRLDPTESEIKKASWIVCNSIKKVLPAILNDSSYLQKLYSLPIYGSDKIVSLNLKEWIWIKKDDLGRVADPYKLLPPVFSDLDIETMDSLITDGSIADGGAAMTAYSRMQFTQMSNEETNLVAQALLKYCELDTLAMVMIYQHWKNEIENQLQKVA